MLRCDSGVCVQGWVRATVRGTGERCCTETPSWLQPPSIKVCVLLLKAAQVESAREVKGWNR